MNITLTDLAPCRKQLRVELDATEVDAAFDEVCKDFQKHAALPGFRPGKAPRAIVLRKYEKDIETEAKQKLISDSYKKAVEEKKLDVLGSPDIEEVHYERGKPMQFLANLETAPDIQLPEYKGLPVKRETASVTDADVERAVRLLQEKQVQFQPAARPARPGDVLVVNYTGTCDGKPISETAPAAQSLTEQKGFWVSTEPGGFLPGFADQLAGASAGEKRTVNIDFPADFATKELAGKKGVFDVEVTEVREKFLPPIDEAFAKTWGAESLEKLKEGVRRDLQNELTYKQNKSIRTQLMRALLDRVNFELPESAVAHETRNVVYDIVRENTKRGISRDVIEQQKDQIYAAAAQNAKERVKSAFLLQKIAEKEDIKVSNEEVVRRVNTLAALYQITPEKFLKDLQKRNGLIEIYDQVANEKVIDFLQQHAAIEDVPPAPTSAATPA